MLDWFQKTRRSIRFIGWRTALQALRYPLYRSWLAARSPAGQAPARTPGLLQLFEAQSRGGEFRFEQGVRLEVRFLAPDMVRTTWTPGQPARGISFTTEGFPDPGELNIHQAPDAVTLASEHLALRVDRHGNLQYTDRQGNLLHHQHPPRQTGPAWTRRSNLHGEERVYGLGSRAAPLNLRPGSYRMWNTSPGGSYGPGTDPLYLCIPVTLHLLPGGCFLLFHENTHDGSLHLPGFATSELSLDPPVSELTFLGGALRTYFIRGSPSHVLERYSALTGRPELPPRWALGFHQSRWGYASEQQVRAVIDGFEQHELPLEAFHQDIDYMDGFRVFTVDRSRFPDMKKLVDDLHSRNIRWVPILDPGIKCDPQFDVYAQGLAQGLFVQRPDSAQPALSVTWPGWCAMPDFTNPKTRRWWSGLYRRLLELGADGIWHDLNEPESFAAWGPPTLPTTARHDFAGRGGDHLEGHNLYGLLMNQAGHEALRKLRPDRRPWILTRSGWAGVQRYAWHWTADVESSWEALRMTIPQVLNIGLSGMPYSGSDIGGFSGDPDAELYTRWFQMAAWLPFFRNHAARGTRPREPWVFGEPYTSVIRASLQLRKRLMPYLYTLAWEAALSGAPLVRPLFWVEPDNPELWQVDDSFMLGDALLVAPILEPNARVRCITLPSGRWTYFWMDYTLEDTHLSEMPASLQRIPIFVRGGSILPLEEQGRLVLHLYPDADGNASGQVFSDAGDRVEGEQIFRLERFELSLEGDSYVLARRSEGEYPFPWEGIDVKMHCSELPVRLVDRSKA